MQSNIGHLIFRADATAVIGTGHIMRCIALAQAWQDRGGNVTFLSHCKSDSLQQRIQDEGFEFIPIEKPHPDPSDLTQTLNVQKRYAPISMPYALRPWITIDGYHFTPDYQKTIRDAGIRLLVIDDMNHLPRYHADILLNQNIHAKKLNYSCDKDTVQLLGCEYALLRREFLKYKDQKHDIPDKAKNILVTMGGADSNNVTLKVINAFKLLDDPDLKVKFLVGPNNPHIDTLENALHNSTCALLNRDPLWGVQSDCSMCLVLNATNMPEIMAWADMAVSAGGSTCWEMAFMGLPSLVITLADNQIGVAEGLAKNGASIDLGWHGSISVKQCCQALKEIVRDKNKRSCLSERGQKLINGKGKQQIIRAIRSGQIKLRRAQEADCALLWKWANDPEVRQSAFNSKSIAWKDHQTWFSKKLNDLDCIIYIALNRYDFPIGQIRFDIKDSIAEIDCSIDKEFRGMGLGRVLLKRGIELCCAEKGNPITIRGCVKTENELSNRAFQSAGFLKAGEKTLNENDVTNTHIIYQLRLFPARKAG